jgi:hypothetical protein
VLGIDDFIQVLLFDVFFHLHKLHHPVHIRQFLLAHFSLRKVTLLFQVLSQCFSHWNWRPTDIVHLDFCSILFEVFFDHGFVLLDWRVFQLVEVTFSFFDVVIQAQFGLVAGLLVVAAERFEASDSFEYLGSQDPNQVLGLGFKLSELFEDLVNESESVNLDYQHIVVCLNDMLG